MEAIIGVLVGEVVQVKLKEGRIVEGLLDPDTLDEYDKNKKIVLTLCCLLHPAQRILTDPKIVLPLHEISFLKAVDVKIDASSARGFKTDAGISKGVLKERELTPWIPDTPVSENVLLSNSGSRRWDQFIANEELFGVVTQFDESAYTTVIDKSSKDYSLRAKKAEKLANEIQSCTSSNVHLQDERGLELQEDQDEEELYGSVARPSLASPPGLPPGLIDKKSLFELESLRISREMAQVEEELRTEVPLEMPASVKSRLNPDAQVFRPMAHLQADAQVFEPAYEEYSLYESYEQYEDPQQYYYPYGYNYY